MSYYNKGDWRLRSNGLNKSNSQPNYFIPKELKSYNSNYLPLIQVNQQAEIFSNKLNKSNKIKNELLFSKYKFLQNRGINDYNKNKFKDSWNDFFKRKERERQRKKVYKIIQDQPYISSEEDSNAKDIFKSDLNSIPNKIEDKLKLKRYLPAKRDLVKLMRKVNDNVNERVDKNNYLLSRNIHNLENGYDDLKDMIENKMNKMERKQEEDFQYLRKYFKWRSNRERDKFDNNNLLMENGSNVLNRYDYNNGNDYYKPTMKENIEKLQTYEIVKRIQNIPNLLDNMIRNIENIREYRNEQKKDFLNNFSESFKARNNQMYDELDYEIDKNNLRYDNYDNYLGNYDDQYAFDEFSNMDNMDPNYFKSIIPRKPRTEVKRNARKDILSMSRTDMDKLRRNLKPLTYQSPIKKLEDDDGLLSGNDLMKIYKEKNSYNKKNSLRLNNTKKSNKINKQDDKTNIINNKKDDKDTKVKKEESDDIVIIDSDEDKSSKKDNNKENNKTPNDAIKKNENEKKEDKKEDKKKENDNSSDKDDEESDEDDDDEDSNNDNNKKVNNNVANNNINNNAINNNINNNNVANNNNNIANNTNNIGNNNNILNLQNNDDDADDDDDDDDDDDND